MSDLLDRVPATIPGLVQPGVAVYSSRDLLTGHLVEGEAGGGLLVWCPTEGDGNVHAFDVGDWDSLDLTDRTSRVHAAWWVDRKPARLSPREAQVVLMARHGQQFNTPDIDTLARLLLRLAEEATMSDLTIPARLMAEGAGLPCPCEVTNQRAYVGSEVPKGAYGIVVTPPDECGFVEVTWLEDEEDAYALLSWSLDDLAVRMTEQTAFGAALRLDKWERARGNMIRWSCDLATLLAFGRDDGRLADLLRRMIARLRVIGEDAMIRRALGWEVEAGSLAEVYWHKALRCWMMKHPSIPTHDNAWAFYSGPVAGALGTDNLGALAGITDPNEARTAIWREVCGG